MANVNQQLAQGQTGTPVTGARKFKNEGERVVVLSYPDPKKAKDTKHIVVKPLDIVEFSAKQLDAISKCKTTLLGDGDKEVHTAKLVLRELRDVTDEPQE